VVGEEKAGVTNANVGPLKWMPPESIRDRAYSEKSDVWAFGVTVYELVTRHEPFPGKNLLEVGVKIRDENYTVLIDQPVKQDCPKYLLQLMEWCFQQDANARPTFKAIGEWLDTNAPAEIRKAAEDFAPSDHVNGMGTNDKKGAPGKGIKKRGAKGKKSVDEDHELVDMSGNMPSRDYDKI
jgi:serine/threonine protein kinase